MKRRADLPEMVRYMDINREAALRLAAEERWEDMIHNKSRKHTRKGGK